MKTTWNIKSSSAEFQVGVILPSNTPSTCPSGNPLLNQELMCATFRQDCGTPLAACDGTSDTYCGTPAADGTSLAACYDSSGIQIRQDRTQMFWGDIQCYGVNCYDLQGALVGICKQKELDSVASRARSLNLPICESFKCSESENALHIPNAETIHGNDFSTCCRCQNGDLLWGAHADGTFHAESHTVEMWLEVPVDVDMKKIAWEDAQNDALQYTEGSSTSAWNISENGDCLVRYALEEELDTFFSAASHFTYDRLKDQLEGMFEFQADKTIQRSFGSYHHSYIRHITQDVPVLFGLEKTANVEATFGTEVGAAFADIAITGIAEESYSENGEIVLNFNILSSSCMEQYVTLKNGSAFISGDLTITWSDEEIWHPDGSVSASCSQDVTIKFLKAEGVFDLPLVFQFQIKAANDAGEFIEEYVNLHIEKPSILDSLPVKAHMTLYFNANRNETSGSFGMGHTVYGRITTTTVVSVDAIHITSLVIEQMGYDNQMKSFDLLTSAWSDYQGGYVSPNFFEFSFELDSTELHITESGSDAHLATISADIEVSYLDKSSTTDRRRLTAGSESDFSIQSMGSFRITAFNSDTEENVTTFRFSSSYKLRALQSAGFITLFVLCVYCIRRQNRHQSEIYTPLIGKYAI